jgi:hypothetical protein
VCARLCISCLPIAQARTRRPESIPGRPAQQAAAEAHLLSTGALLWWSCGGSNHRGAALQSGSLACATHALPPPPPPPPVWTPLGTQPEFYPAEACPSSTVVCRHKRPAPATGDDDQGDDDSTTVAPPFEPTEYNYTGMECAQGLVITTPRPDIEPAYCCGNRLRLPGPDWAGGDNDALKEIRSLKEGGGEEKKGDDGDDGADGDGGGTEAEGGGQEDPDGVRKGRKTEPQGTQGEMRVQKPKKKSVQSARPKGRKGDQGCAQLPHAACSSLEMVSDGSE